MSAQRKEAPDDGSRPNESSNDKGVSRRHKKAAPSSGQNNTNCSETSCLDSSSSILHNQPWVHVIVLACCIVAMAYLFGSRPSESVVAMARQNEVIEGKRYLDLVCPPSFRQEVQDLNNEECLPSKCGRVIFDNIVSNSSVHRLLEMAKRGFALGGSSGPTSYLDLHSGMLSKGEQFMNVYKVKPDLYDEEDFELHRKVTGDVHLAVADHFKLSPENLYMSNPTMFHRLIDYPGRSVPDPYWLVHRDRDAYPSVYYNTLLYLTDYGRDFKGGRFIFTNEDKTNSTVEPRLGRLSAYTTGEENLHYVERVTEGTRYIFQMAFSCDKSKKVSNVGSHLD